MNDQEKPMKVTVDSCPLGEELAKKMETLEGSFNGFRREMSTSFSEFRTTVESVMNLHGRDVSDLTKKLFGNGDEYLSLVGRVKRNDGKLREDDGRLDDIEKAMVTKEDVEKQSNKTARNITVVVGIVGLLIASITVGLSVRTDRVTMERLTKTVEEIKRMLP